jgi:hypothetical protein
MDSADILKHYNLEELLHIPTVNASLDSVKYVDISHRKDFAYIPKMPGVYFICTNEPINHTFHKKKLPATLPDGFKIIYNGTSTNLQERSLQHLYRDKSNGMSGISIDLLTNDEKVESHTKCCYSISRKKTPYVNNKRIVDLTDLINMYLSNDERQYIDSNQNKSIIHFKNGINIRDKKHSDYRYRLYYIEVSSHSVRDIIETNWRKEYGVPCLCSYSEGR